MPSETTWDRANEYGVINIITSLSFWLPGIVALVLYVFFRDIFSPDGMSNFVGAATGASQSLIAVTLTGLAILVSFADEDFLSYLNDKGNYSALLFIFEYTVILALFVTLCGTLLQSLSYEKWVFYVFLFLFLHLLVAIVELMRTILEFAKYKADYDAVNNIEPDEVPQELKDDLEAIVDKVSSEDNGGPEQQDREGHTEREPE